MNNNRNYTLMCNMRATTGKMKRVHLGLLPPKVFASGKADNLWQPTQRLRGGLIAYHANFWLNPKDKLPGAKKLRLQGKVINGLPLWCADLPPKDVLLNGTRGHCRKLEPPG